MARKTSGGHGRIASRVRALARNLWWTWNPQAQSLFASMHPELWQATHHNPLRTLNLLPPEHRRLIESDGDFIARLDGCERDMRAYLRAATWFDRQRRRGRTSEVVAYFCAEYAFHESLPIYSGGLGVLAGDHVKSASDLGLPFVAVGLLYRCGYYTQQFNPDGSTRVIYPQLDFDELPIEFTGKRIAVPMAAGSIRAKIWKLQVGRVPVYLLDTDTPENSSRDRALSRHLYGGDREYRIRQEILLGVGGVLALQAMKIRATAFHLNEGHAAFCTLKRLADLRGAGESLAAGRQFIRRTTVFTTHTPVPAGNDRFAPRLAMKYMSRLAGAIGLSRDQILALGREDPANRSEEFCMTVLALRLADHCNGVAALHGETSRRMWMKVYNATTPDDVPIGHITNGIHTATWLAPEFPRRISSSAALWAARRMLRTRMIRFIRARLVNQILRRGGSIPEVAAAQAAFDDDTLTIGFARRFATYKRAPLIFRDAGRLARILNHPSRPVQIVFAGKAHPRDEGGQNYAQQIFRHAQESRFRGRVVILEDYDMEVGRMLTSGCDVWLNTPLRPQEASGTSGMKPPLHGGINCSILDGWWPEAFNGRNGWAINGKQFKDQTKQDSHDARQIYRLLEREIVPMFYDRDRSGLPRRWIAMMRESMRSISGRFSTDRMVREYWQKYYSQAVLDRPRRIAERPNRALMRSTA
jgi:starch phosphorylase